MDVITLSKPNRSLQGEIQLDGSKSISNRAVIALALAGADPKAWLSNCSTSKDTTTLLRLLTQQEGPYDAGDAGTTFRFLTAFLATRPGEQILTGSARMQERPIGGLVEALRGLGANIEYMEREGYPPLRIGALKTETLGQNRPRVSIQAGTSSQFLSAMLLIGPYLPQGLTLVPEGNLVSRPYLDMTLRLMRAFGAEADWVENGTIEVAPGGYVPHPFTVEADWSAASYWYSMAAFSDDLDLKLKGLFADSWQGDAVLSDMMQAFGVQTEFEADGIRLRASGAATKPQFEWDFLACPDIAQTLAVVCAGLGVTGVFSGLETLSIKETDRIAALRQELAKVGVVFSKLPAHFSKKSPDKKFYLVDGKATWDAPPVFATYGDHRMAMAFAPLAFFAPVSVEHPKVVSKSYPQFWEHCAAIGIQHLPSF